ncbi:MAG: energy transducer TonB [Balneola sp.]|tara:strand:+ start:4627 stop:5064 length:438 start_codon:yes stop_codon:yes gene_type:complete
MINLKSTILTILLPLFVLSGCVSTNQTASFKGTEFFTETGSRVIVGELLTEQGFPVDHIDIKVNKEFINYPQVAQRAGIEGVVRLFIDVSEQKKIEKIRVTRGIGGGCDEAALNLIRNSEFIVTSKKTNNNTVSERYYISVLYEL